MQTTVLLMAGLGIVLHALQGAACQQGGIEGAAGKESSEVDAREFGTFLVHGFFSPLPWIPAHPSYLFHSTGVVIAP